MFGATHCLEAINSPSLPYKGEDNVELLGTVNIDLWPPIGYINI